MYRRVSARSLKLRVSHSFEFYQFLVWTNAPFPIRVFLEFWNGTGKYAEMELQFISKLFISFLIGIVVRRTMCGEIINKSTLSLQLRKNTDFDDFRAIT